jgi:hypothetical protein
VSLIYWDTMLFVYLIESHPEHEARLRKIQAAITDRWPRRGLRGGGGWTGERGLVRLGGGDARGGSGGNGHRVLLGGLGSASREGGERRHP